MTILYALAVVEGCAIVGCAYIVAACEISRYVIQRQNRRFALEAKQANEARYILEAGPYRGY